LFLTVLFISTVSAQEKRINLYGGYVFDDNLSEYYDSYNYINATVKGGFQYGGSIEFLTPDKLGFELLYMGHNTTIPLTGNAGFSNGQREATNDLNLNYAMVSINKYSDVDGKVEGYGGLLLGCLFSDVTNTGVSDTTGLKIAEGASSSGTRFSWGLKLGTNIWVKENIGIKLQAQFLSTTEAIGGSSYYGYYGSYYGYYSYINMFQWSFSSGLVFKLGGK
jgi:hypothetical protein